MASEITLKILSYNVFMRDLGGDFLGIKAGVLDAVGDLGRILGVTDQDGGVKFVNKKRAELIGNLIAAGDYDVVVFQEAFDDDARKKLREHVARGGFKHSSSVVGGDSFGGSDGGIFIMSKWPLLDSGQTIYRNGTGIDARAQKGVLWALINKEGFLFNVFGTHAQAGTSLREASSRSAQFIEFRGMIEHVGFFWLPALLAGDFNVDYAAVPERENMLRTLQAALPENRSRHTPTSDPANELKDDQDPPTTLDYVLFANDPQPSPVRPRPKRSALETIKFRAPYTVQLETLRPIQTTLNDLSDHYAVLGTFTFERPREDWRHFRGTWKSMFFNNQPDLRDWRITFDFLGRNIISVINGRSYEASIHQIKPGPEIRGEIVLYNRTRKIHEKFFYGFGQNDSFRDQFRPPDRIGGPPTLNELMLRNASGTGTTLFAFESYLPRLQTPE
jgi:phospholipase C